VGGGAQGCRLRLQLQQHLALQGQQHRVMLLQQGMGLHQKWMRLQPQPYSQHRQLRMQLQLQLHPQQIQMTKAFSSGLSCLVGL
jgi:hypothetical protein